MYKYYIFISIIFLFCFFIFFYRGYTTEQILEKIINNVHSTERLEKVKFIIIELIQFSGRIYYRIQYIIFIVFIQYIFFTISKNV